MNISIFAKKAFLNVNSSQPFEYGQEPPKRGHLMRVSSMIRADQIADQLGAKLNPIYGFDEDVCIYVKPHVQPGKDFDFEGKRTYLDIIDGWGLVPLLQKHPEVGVIACSKQDVAKLLKVLDNKITFIPQHHCNFDRIKRSLRNSITTVGVIGTQDAFEHIPDEIREGLAQRGLKFIEYSKFFRREDIINFYKQIDIQLVWRPYRMRLSNPLKIVNAASFGIPTIAYEESVFNEVDDCHVPVKTPDEFFAIVEGFMRGTLYSVFSNQCLKVAENYHIEKVAELYKQL